MITHIYITGGNVNNIATYENRLAVPYKVNHALPYDPAMLLLCIYPSEIKIHVHTETSMWVVFEFSRETKAIECVYMYKEIYYK